MALAGFFTSALKLSHLRLLKFFIKALESLQEVEHMNNEMSHPYFCFLDGLNYRGQECGERTREFF